jgi:tripartite-type tricarboxylate transporter receptor subunit TctC
MKFSAQLVGLGLAIVGALCAPQRSLAQEWPTRQAIRFVVVYPPGGASDVTARLLAAKLTDTLGQSVVVENRPGANGIIATDFVAKSAPDGYTLLMANLGPNALNPVVYKKLPYDAVNPSLPIKSIPDLIAYAKANPGKVSFGSAGQGASNHLSGELLNALAGIRMQHIPYKGDAPSLADLISGQIQVALPTTVAGLPFVTSGKLRAIGVTGAKRLDNMPDLPTVAETLRGFEAVSWGGVMVPAGTPKPVVARLNADINRILKMPDVADKLKALGAVIVGSSPEEFDTYVKDEIAKWGKVARENNIALD